MNGEETGAPKKRSKLFKILLVLMGILILAIAAGSWYYHRSFPYGSTHACSKQIGLSFRVYANDHDGWLPYGKATPEESLAIAVRDSSAEYLFGGKHIPREKVKAALADGRFGPEVCGWHYIEGLREDDDLQLAVAWDKAVGLDHNGMRRDGLMHEVIYLDGSTGYISKSGWPEFIATEKKLLEEIIAKRQTNAPKIRWSDEASLGPNRFPAAAK